MYSRICLNYIIINNQHDTIVHISFLCRDADSLTGLGENTVAVIKWLLQLTEIQAHEFADVTYHVNQRRHFV